MFIHASPQTLSQLITQKVIKAAFLHSVDAENDASQGEQQPEFLRLFSL